MNDGAVVAAGKGSDRMVRNARDSIAVARGHMSWARDPRASAWGRDNAEFWARHWLAIARDELRTADLLRKYERAGVQP